MVTSCGNNRDTGVRYTGNGRKKREAHDRSTSAVLNSIQCTDIRETNRVIRFKVYETNV